MSDFAHRGRHDDSTEVIADMLRNGGGTLRASRVGVEPIRPMSHADRCRMQRNHDHKRHVLSVKWEAAHPNANLAPASA